jgi:hypothetical protein
MKSRMNKIGACGDGCSFCLRYTATKSNKTDELNRVRDLWVKLGWRDNNVDAQELKCSGCRKENKCAYPELRDCAFGKNLENCGMCRRYPCKLIEAAFEKTENTFQTLNITVSKENMDSLLKAFRCKKANLDTIYTRHNAKNQILKTGMKSTSR